MLGYLPRGWRRGLSRYLDTLGQEARTMLCVLPTPHHDRRKSSCGPHRAEKIQNARAAEKLERIRRNDREHTRGRCRICFLASVGLDRALKIDRSGKTSQIFLRTVESQLPRSPRRIDQKRPKSTKHHPKSIQHHPKSTNNHPKIINFPITEVWLFSTGHVVL